MAPALPVTMAADLASFNALTAKEEQFAEAADFLRERPGPAFCESLLLCFDAGKPEAVDLFLVDARYAMGKLSAEEFVRMIDARNFGAIQVENSKDGLLSPVRPIGDFVPKLAARYQVGLQNARFGILVSLEESRR